MEISGTSAVVTGAGSGLGEAAARRLHAAGAHVVLADINRDAAERVAKELGERAVAVAGDACTEEGLSAAVGAARQLAPLRVAVACAGGGQGDGRTVHKDGSPHDLAVYERMIRLNLVSAFNTVRMAGAEMSGLDPVDGDGQRGVIVTTASIAGYEGQIGQVAYGSAKAGVIGMTLIAARDLSGAGIRVNCVAPGLLLTPAWGPAAGDHIEAFAATVPFPKRFGQPAEFAELVAHLVANDYINGQVIRLDGAIRFGPR
jgi:NAD(P)-dependent dehydrogenase (short-subunit alcohol dehydrogenase family)